MDQLLNWHKAHHKNLSVGDRAADKMRNGMGSWRFVLGFIFFMIAWAFINTQSGFRHWDNFPFILLNLFLSMIAGLQGAVLLIASRRADSISAAMAEHDYRTNVSAAKDIQRLMEINHQQVVMIKELSDRLDKYHAKRVN